MDVYLVRHAPAFQRDAERWPNDRERPLTPAGCEKFALAAPGLGALVGEVDAVLSSSFVRTWQTATLLEDGLGWPAPVRCPRLEPGHPPDAALEDLAGFPADARLVLVGHEPMLSMLLSTLLVGDPFQLTVEFKKGGAACVRLDGVVRRGNGRLRWLLKPQMLRRLARWPGPDAAPS